MFENFTFDTARSPSLDSSDAPSTARTSRSVSPCSAIGPFPPARFSVTDLAAQLADQRVSSSSRISYDSCEAYAANDDDAGWSVAPSIETEFEIAPSPTALEFKSARRLARPHSPTQRSQRQANARLLCTSTHREDIAALVSRMVQTNEQCSVSEANALALIPTISEDDEGYNSSDGATPMQSRRSSVANLRRTESRRGSDLKSTTACVSKSARFVRDKALSRVRSSDRA